MPTIKLKDRIKKGLFLLDGAMGTQLIARGITAGKCISFLNIESPQVVLDIQSSYIRAGSDAVITNTFGANRYALARYKLNGEMARINKSGAEIARRAAGRDKYVLGNIGPSGEFLEPIGTLKEAELKQAFIEQAEALSAGGVDGFIIETMTALDEITVAIDAVKLVTGTLPVFASMAFDRVKDGFRTSMGVDVSSAVSAIIEKGVDAAGFNCGRIPVGEYEKLAVEYCALAKALGEGVAVFAEPNAGEPELRSGKTVYSLLPEDFAAEMQVVYQAGVHIIGGCCGTGPEHIKAIAELLKAKEKHF